MTFNFRKEICAFFQNQHPPPARNLISPNHSTSSNSANTLSSMPNVQITSLLSISFRRLDKYPALLQELQRYTEENHSDRGDIQRAGFVYREISVCNIKISIDQLIKINIFQRQQMSCLELRRRKEMELEVMLGNIKNFDNFVSIVVNVLKIFFKILIYFVRISRTMDKSLKWSPFPY